MQEQQEVEGGEDVEQEEQEEIAEGKGNTPLGRHCRQRGQQEGEEGEGGGVAQQVVVVVAERAAAIRTASSASWYQKRPSPLERRVTSISTRYLPRTQPATTVVVTPTEGFRIAGACLAAKYRKSRRRRIVKVLGGSGS